MSITLFRNGEKYTVMPGNVDRVPTCKKEVEAYSVNFT